MTLKYKPDLDKITVNNCAKYLDQRSFCSKVIVWMHKHTAD